MKQEPKEEKEHSIGFLIFLIISATVIGVLFINSLNCCIPEHAKFNSEVWGTVSDWFTYLASAIGIAFILKTFESQRKVQEDQEKINRFNALDFRSKHRADILNDESINYKEPFSSLRCLHFIIKDNNALNINVESPIKLDFSRHDEEVYKIKNKITLDNKTFNYNISAIFKDKSFRIEVDENYVKDFLSKNNTKEIIEKLFLVIKITYEDNFNNTYRKGFEVWFTPFSKMINIVSTNVDYIE